MQNNGWYLDKPFQDESSKSYFSETKECFYYLEKKNVLDWFTSN